jgi:ABC-2 type transport system ATP-binding protein
MDHGRLLALDEPARLKASVGAVSEARLHAGGDLDRLARHLEALDGVSGGRVVDGVVHVHVAQGGPTLPELITHADRGGFHVTDAGMTEPTLETVFIDLTGKELRE